MADALMENAPKSEELWSLYDLEYRAGEDDAWYNVYAVLDADAHTLTVKYMCSPKRYKIVLSAAGFETEAQVEELVARFRPVSQQVQDHQCGTLSVGTTVCASHGIGDYDLRFFDAVIEAVSRQAHSYSDGEEECLCTFLLFWKHGRGHGTITSAKIASICIIKPAIGIDYRISAFAKMAKEKIKSSKCISASVSLDSTSIDNCHVFVEKKSGSCRNKPQEIKSQMRRSEDSENNNYNQWTSQDEDMGPKHCTTDGLATYDDHYSILLSNLEKDITPSAIKNFIYKQTAILPEAYVFPRLLSDPFARGAIVVDCQKKVQIIYEFLGSPNHLVVSSRGRPWVVTEKAGTFGSNILNLIPIAPGQITHKITCEELKVVRTGTESYKRAKQLRDLFVEYMNHESKLCKNLAFEEKRILQSC
ncbi:hypothetical protein ACS0TY_010659 [Phlomoides rotata]